jgi:hypothetical protein
MGSKGGQFGQPADQHEILAARRIQFAIFGHFSGLLLDASPQPGDHRAGKRSDDSMPFFCYVAL